MATVQFSQSLRQEIRSKAQDSFRPRLDKLREEMPKHLGEEVYRKMFGAYLEHIKALPVQFFNKTDYLVVRFYDGFTKTHVAERFSVPVCVVPLNKLELPQGEYEGYSKTITIHDHPMWADVLKEFFDWYMKVQYLLNEQKNFVESITTIVAGHHTVNSALKTWPLLKEYIPQQVLTKMYEPATRNKKAAIEFGDIDINKLTGVAVANKLAK